MASMKNEFQLQKVWFTKVHQFDDLFTTDGQSLKVLNSGRWNNGQGPDFLMAQLMIGELLWAGHVEVHIKTSFWFLHSHDQDPHYENVVLHVVWEHDLTDFNRCPVLELKTRCSDFFISSENISFPFQLPCAPFQKNAAGADPFLQTWLEKRLSAKVDHLLQHLRESRGDLQQVRWTSILRSFGQTVNADAFEELGKVVPFQLISLYRKDRKKMAALLMGQAGLLKSSDPSVAVQELLWIYQQLQFTHRLVPIHSRILMLRLRPENFPQKRLLQVCDMVEQMDDLQEIFEHDLAYPAFAKKIGINPGSMVLSNLYINTFIPFRLVQKKWRGEKPDLRSSIERLEKMRPEKSRLMQCYISAGIKPRHAAHSQALIELYLHKCSRSNCDGCHFKITQS